MPFHFCSHAWDVEDVADGTRITLSPRDLLDESTLADDLLQVVLESGRPILYLDFARIRQVSSDLLDQLTSLERRLHEHGCRLIVLEVHAELRRLFDTATSAPGLDIRNAVAAETLS